MVLYVKRGRRATIVDSVATLPNTCIVMNDPGYRQAFFILQKKKLIRDMVKKYKYMNFNIFLTTTDSKNFAPGRLKCVREGHQ